MKSFFDALDVLGDSVLGVMVGGALCAFLGVYVLLRRVVFVSAAMTQASGVGIALSFWFSSFAAQDEHRAGPSWLSPQLFSLLAAVGVALLLSRQLGKGRLAQETMVGLTWVISGAALLLILSSRRVVQEAHQVDNLLYGQAVLITRPELVTLAAVAAALLVLHVAFRKEFLFVSFDAEMARTLGYRVALWDALLFSTVAVGVALVVRLLGALPTFGFLVLPGAAAQLLFRRAGWLFPAAAVLGLIGGFFGFYLAFAGWPSFGQAPVEGETAGLPTGPSLVAVLSLLLLPGIVFRALRRG